MSEIHSDKFDNLTPHDPARLDHHIYTTIPLWMRVLAVACGSFVLVFGGLGNLTTLVAFVRNKHKNLWQRQYVNIYCMAFTDCVVCFYSCSNLVIKYAVGRWPFSALYCSIFWSISTWAFNASLHAFVLVGYDRYLIVKHGAEYERIETWRKVLVRTILYSIVWPAAFCPFVFLNYFTGTTVNAPGDCLPEFVQLGFLFPLLSWAAFCSPVGHMTFFYVKVYKYTCNRAQRGQANLAIPSTKIIIIPAIITTPAVAALAAAVVTERPNAAQFARQKRAARTLKYLFSSVLICYLPFFIVAILTTLVMLEVIGKNGGFFSNPAWWLQLLDLMQVIGWINNAINPLLYAYTMPRLHEEMVNVWNDASRSIWSAMKVKPLFTNH